MITPYVPLVLRENLEKVGNPRHKIMCRERLCRLVGGLSAKCADFWLSGRHVADMSATFPAKPPSTTMDAISATIVAGGQERLHHHGDGVWWVICAFCVVFDS